MISDAARRKMKKLDRDVQDAIDGKIATLANWPNVGGAIPLYGAGRGHFRLKARNYRIIFHVDEKAKVVYIDMVEHRSAAYDPYHHY